MRRTHILFLVLFLFPCALLAQKASLKGAVADTVDKKNLQNTSITLMRAGDSVLVKHARADNSGRFVMQNVDSGKFVLMITHPYLGDYFDQIELTPGQEKDLGMIQMTPKTKLLQEVIVSSGSPIKIKGDTTIYTADSFKVRPGANVEELLRRLPGIQVDKDGKITAMGERVKRVLVDGEEFFGSDPGVVTKNLRADNVKEVQVFDKKSDQAEFTGIDDGVKDKTINLKLKELKGYFGKIEASGGIKDMYNNTAMVNNFRNKRKFAAYGIMSNTGQTNLDFQDAQNYSGGDLESGVTDDGGIYINYTGDNDDNYQGGRRGIPQNWNGGIHYSNKFNDNKLSLNGGYKFAKVNAPATINTFSKNFGLDTSYLTNTTDNSFSSRIKHGFNMTVEATLDSNNSLKWTTRANHNLTSSDSRYFRESLSLEGDSINNSLRKTDNESEVNGLVSTLLWKHKFKKLSRTLSVNTDINWNRNVNNGILYSLNNYYQNGVFNYSDTTDQMNVNAAESQSFTTRVAYTEPLMKDTYLELNYALNYYNNNNDRVTSEKSNSSADKYDVPIDTLSISYTFKRLVNTPGANFRINKKKYSISFGSSVGFSRFIQDNHSKQTTLKYSFVNFFPRASIQLKMKPNENFRFNYNGSTQAPTVDQLQPIRVITDIFNVYEGNSDLDQAFRHNFSLSYNFFNILKEKGIWTSLSYNNTQNAFVQSSTYDLVGRRTYKTVNADGVYNINFYSDYNFKIKDTKWQIGMGPNASYSHSIDFVTYEQNNITTKNITRRNSYGFRTSISQWVQDKYNFYIGPNFTYNRSTATVNTAANAKYWQLEGWAQGSVTTQGKLKVEIGTNLNFQARQKDPRFPANNNFTTWNGYLIKRFYKNQFEAKFSVNDILNQNRGFQRDFTSSSFTESYYTTLKRFWLLTLTWNFSKNGKPATW